MPYIFISNYVPLDFVDTARDLPDTYNYKHMDQFFWEERVQPWEQAPCWYQKWQKNDIIFMQFESDADPVRVKLVDTEGTEFQNFIATNKAVIGSRIFTEAAIALDTTPEGIYKVLIVYGTLTLESNWIYIKQKHPGTLLYKYSHNSNKGLLWQTNIYFLMRIDGAISKYKPYGNRTIYIDQPMNAKTVKGYSARAFTLVIGGPEGVPDFVPDKVQDIFDCNNVILDGKGFSAKEPGSQLTEAREEQYAFAAWTLDITETNNRRGKRFEDSGLIEHKVLIDYIVDGKFFGPIAGSANNNTYTIKKVE